MLINCLTTSFVWQFRTTQYATDLFGLLQNARDQGVPLALTGFLVVLGEDVFVKVEIAEDAELETLEELAETREAVSFVPLADLKREYGETSDEEFAPYTDDIEATDLVTVVDLLLGPDVSDEEFMDGLRLLEYAVKNLSCARK